MVHFSRQAFGYTKYMLSDETDLGLMVRSNFCVLFWLGWPLSVAVNTIVTVPLWFGFGVPSRVPLPFLEENESQPGSSFPPDWLAVRLSLSPSGSRERTA